MTWSSQRLSPQTVKALWVRPNGVALLAPGADAVISLLDPDGLKVDGVAYTKAQAERKGWSLVF
jgi:hypothetical protein